MMLCLSETPSTQLNNIREDDGRVRDGKVVD